MDGRDVRDLARRVTSRERMLPLQLECLALLRVEAIIFAELYAEIP